MSNQQNPYQIDIQKIIPNPSKPRNSKFGEIENHKRANFRFSAAASAPAVGWSFGAQRRGGDGIGLGMGGAVLQV